MRVEQPSNSPVRHLRRPELSSGWSRNARSLSPQRAALPDDRLSVCKESLKVIAAAAEALL